MILEGINSYSIRKIYEDEQVKEEDFQGNTQVKKKNGRGEQAAQGEEEEEVDIQELLKNVDTKINFSTAEDLKNASMHHFKLKTREVVEVYRFEGVEAVNSLQHALLNFIMERSQLCDVKSKTQGPQIQIIAPKLFINSTYKECNLTNKGSVEARNQAAVKNGAQAEKQEKFGVRYEGVIFPQAVTRICQLFQTVSKTRKEATRFDLLLKSDENSLPFSHLSIMKQIVLNRDSKDFKVLLE